MANPRLGVLQQGTVQISELRAREKSAPSALLFFWRTRGLTETENRTYPFPSAQLLRARSLISSTRPRYFYPYLSIMVNNPPTSAAEEREKRTLTSLSSPPRVASNSLLTLGGVGAGFAEVARVSANLLTKLVSAQSKE